MLLVLSLAACQHIAYTMNERAWRGTELLSQSGSEELRLRFVKACRGKADPMMFALNRAELRALDTLLTDADPREGKLPDGTPILALVETIWDALIGDGHAGHEDDHINAHANHGASAGRSDPLPLS